MASSHDFTHFPNAEIEPSDYFLGEGLSAVGFTTSRGELFLDQFSQSLKDAFQQVPRAYCDTAEASKKLQSDAVLEFGQFFILLNKNCHPVCPGLTTG